MLQQEPTEPIKKKLISTVDKIKLSNDESGLSKQIDQYSIGYLYGNPWVHKSISDLPDNIVVGYKTYQPYSKVSLYHRK